MQNISFQGHSSLFLNSKNFDKAARTAKSYYRDLGTKNKCTLRNGSVFTTSADSDTLALIVRNNKSGFVKHVPTSGRIGKIIEEITQKIEELKTDSKEKLTAWIIGGEKFEGEKGSNTINRVNELAEIVCDKPDIDASILAGSKKGAENIALHPRAEGLEITLDRTNCDLEDAFDIVELNNTEII